MNYISQGKLLSGFGMSPVANKEDTILFTKKYIVKSIHTAPVAEIFSAIQGEGTIAGVRQLFIRFYNCNMNCNWCDTPAAHMTNGPCIVEESPGSRKNITLKNPFSPLDLFNIAQPFLSFPHHSISLTGGEPLLYYKFLQDFLPMIKKYKNNKPNKIYLETNGTLPLALEKVIPWIDIIGMDWKLQSSTKDKDFTNEHRLFLQKASPCNLFIKIIVSRDTDNKELLSAYKMIANEFPDIPIILQPVTTSRKFPDILEPTPKQLLDWQGTALSYFSDVRVIPQTHILINQR